MIDRRFRLLLICTIAALVVGGCGATPGAPAPGAASPAAEAAPGASITQTVPAATGAPAPEVQPTAPATAAPTIAPATAAPTVAPAPGTFATDLEATQSAGYALIFMIDPAQRDQIAGYMVACGASGGFSMPTAPGLMDADVPIENGTFTIDNKTALISGQLKDAVTFEGTIEARSEEATNCGIPKSARWTAKCGVETGITSLVIGGKSVYSESGPCK